MRLLQTPNAKLKEADVRAVRIGYKEGLSVKQLARYYGVSAVAIYKLLEGETWGHVE